MNISLLGTGQMGAAIARRLHGAGHRVIVWNRTAQKLEALVREGFTVAASIQQAVKDTGIIFTMLTDDAAIEQVVLKEGGVADLMPEGMIHVSLSTLSV